MKVYVRTAKLCVLEEKVLEVEKTTGMDKYEFVPLRNELNLDSLAVPLAVHHRMTLHLC